MGLLGLTQKPTKAESIEALLEYIVKPEDLEKKVPQKKVWFDNILFINYYF